MLGNKPKTVNCQPVPAELQFSCRLHEIKRQIQFFSSCSLKQKVLFEWAFKWYCLTIIQAARHRKYTHWAHLLLHLYSRKYRSTTTLDGRSLMWSGYDTRICVKLHELHVFKLAPCKLTIILFDIAYRCTSLPLGHHCEVIANSWS